MRKFRRSSLVVLGVLAAGIVLELGVRAGTLLSPSLAEELRRDTSAITGIDLSQWVAHPFLPFIGRPDSSYVTRGSHGVIIRVDNNEYGFRTHPFPARKEPNDRFIVCLGESTTWGSAATDNAATWPELLEAKLAARYPQLNVRVFNLGVPTGTTAYSVAALTLLGVRLHPDLVIVYHGANEYGTMLSTDFRYDHSHHFHDFNPDSAWYGLRRNLPPLLLRSYAVAYTAALIDRRLGVDSMGFHIVKDNPDKEAFPSRGVGVTMENLGTIAAIARGEGGEALFSTFQFYDGNSPSPRLLNDALREFFDSRGLWYVDQEKLIPDYDRSINIDEVHFTRKGDEMMAENFFEAIVARGLLEKPPAYPGALATGFD